MPTKPYREQSRTRPHSKELLHERINNPEHPSSIADVVTDLIAEERKVEAATRKAWRSPVATIDPCEDSPTGAHWWRYPAQGSRKPAVCRFCYERK